MEFFRHHARRYGFHEEEYLAAVNSVPRYSRDVVKEAILFCSKLAGMVSALSYTNILLSRALSERKKAEDVIRASLREKKRS